MRLFGNRNTAATAPVPDELNAYYTPPESGPRRILGLIARIVALLLILALLFWFGFWLTQKLSNRTANNRPTTQQTEQEKDKAQQGTTKPDQAVPAPAPGSGDANRSPATGQQGTSAPSAPSTTTPPASGGSSTGTLPKTGG